MLKAAICAALLLAPLPAGATDVDIRVLNMADAAGSVRVEICLKAEWLEGCAISAHAPATAGIAVVTVRGVPPGEYGVIAHHDSDDDGEVNRNFLGLPTEGIGFSHDAPIRLGPPRFEDAVLRIQGARVVVDINLSFERAARR